MDSKVEVQSPETMAWYPATILDIHDETFDIKYEGSWGIEEGVPGDRVRAIPRHSVPLSESDLKPGEKVEVLT